MVKIRKVILKKEEDYIYQEWFEFCYKLEDGTYSNWERIEEVVSYDREE